MQEEVKKLRERKIEELTKKVKELKEIKEKTKREERVVRRTMRPLREVWMRIGLEKIDTHEGVTVRSANSKPELSQLLFISVGQRELVKSSCWIGLSTYTSTT